QRPRPLRNPLFPPQPIRPPICRPQPQPLHRRRLPPHLENRRPFSISAPFVIPTIANREESLHACRKASSAEKPPKRSRRVQIGLRADKGREFRFDSGGVSKLI